MCERRKVDVHKINGSNSYTKKKKRKKLTTIYGKFNSTAKIKSTSKINSSTIRQIS